MAEGLYSMDGDCADVAALVEIKRRHGAWLMVDDAHVGSGCSARPAREASSWRGSSRPTFDIWMGTMSKTLSGCGGYIAGCQTLVEYLKCMSGGFVYSVGMPPPMAAAAIAALRLMHREPERGRATASQQRPVLDAGQGA